MDFAMPHDLENEWLSAPCKLEAKEAIPGKQEHPFRKLELFD